MRYRFGDHVLDVMCMRLSHKGIELDVARRVFCCLIHLIRHRERVVKRDELIHHVWNRDNVSDHQLAQVVRAARQVLGDDGNSQNMIRTVLGVGYHWCADIVEMGPEERFPRHYAPISQARPPANQLPLAGPTISLIIAPAVAAHVSQPSAPTIPVLAVTGRVKGADDLCYEANTTTSQSARTAATLFGRSVLSNRTVAMLIALNLLLLAWQTYSVKPMPLLATSIQTCNAPTLE